MYDITSLRNNVKKTPVILAIESSCDETAAAVLQGGRQVLSSEILSSCTEHVRFGGVVPEIASRAHTVAISMAVDRALKKAGVTLKDLDAVAVTYGAGLVGALLVGVSYAKALAWSLNIPLVPVSHIRGHLAASYLANTTLQPPFIGLLASGGHTAVMLVKDYDTFEILGSTLDDAVGEAFDKVARVLGLEYPGGPNVEKLAKEGTACIPFPKMLKGGGGYDFSYSGLKTYVINAVNTATQKGETVNRADMAASFQSAALDVLVEKSIKAAKEYGVNTIAVGGGVAANGYLRDAMVRVGEEAGICIVLPPKWLCTDNAAMIGAEGYLQYQKGNFAGLDLNAVASLPL